MNAPARVPSLQVKQAHSSQTQPELALHELARELDAESASAVLLYCSSSYDLERLGPAIAQHIQVPVVACTTAGQIGARGFERGGITGVSLHSSDLEMHPHLLSPLALCKTQASSLAREQAARKAQRPGLRSFGVLLVDGHSMWEEFVVSALYESLGDVTVVGGSAATDGGEQAPGVYHRGRFHRGAAVLALFETTTLGFAAFSAQHFVASHKKLVITLADPDRRIVYEINGEPAARAYAQALGVDEAELGPEHFACNPLILQLGQQLLPRAIRARQADGSLLLACAIDEGLVVSIAESRDPLATLQQALDDVEQRVPAPATLLVFDCVLRRTELQATGLEAEVGELLARRGAIGFSGFGEQLGPLHTNHTLTGLALGATAEPRR